MPSTRTETPDVASETGNGAIGRDEEREDVGGRAPSAGVPLHGKDTSGEVPDGTAA
jgi:hypothetical protein